MWNQKRRTRRESKKEPEKQKQNTEKSTFGKPPHSFTLLQQQKKIWLQQQKTLLTKRRPMLHHFLMKGSTVPTIATQSSTIESDSLPAVSKEHLTPVLQSLNLLPSLLASSCCQGTFCEPIKSISVINVATLCTLTILCQFSVVWTKEIAVK